MPTRHRRFAVTETPELARLLDDAATRWSHDRAHRGKLLLHLVREGHRAISAEGAALAEQRRAGIQRSSGALTGAYPDGYLDDLRDDWPV